MCSHLQQLAYLDHQEGQLLLRITLEENQSIVFLFLTHGGNISSQLRSSQVVSAIEDITVIKDIKPDDSKDMTASKLLGLVNSRAVVCQPWEDSNKLAKKTVFSWKNNTLRVVKTMFQLVPSSSPSPACPVLAQEPLESSPKACLSLLADPKPVWVPKSNLCPNMCRQWI